MLTTRDAAVGAPNCNDVAAQGIALRRRIKKTRRRRPLTGFAPHGDGEA